MRVIGCWKPKGAMKVTIYTRVCRDKKWQTQCGPVPTARSGAEEEHMACYPKDGELCLTRTKSEETLMEVRSGSDVQIDRQSWVKGRKTNRTI
jgi:hypothetical protein